MLARCGRAACPRAGPVRLVWTGLGLIGLSTLAGLYLQAPYTTGGGLFDVSVPVTCGTCWPASSARPGDPVGRAAGDRDPGPAVLMGEGGTVDQALLAVFGVAGLATWALSGHPTATPVPAVTVVADTAHVAGMAVWLGGLVMLVGFLLRRGERHRAGRDPAGLVALGRARGELPGAPGIVQALVEVGTWVPCWTPGTASWCW